MILDVMMPKMNGFKISRLLKFDVKYKNIPILMLTARSQEADKQIGEETGANEYITKSLYENHATITSIYPDGVDISNYKISNKQKQDFAKYDLFVYNGLLEKERKYVLQCR